MLILYSSTSVALFHGRHCDLSVKEKYRYIINMAEFQLAASGSLEYLNNEGIVNVTSNTCTSL